MTFIANVPGSVTTVTAPPANQTIATPFAIDATGGVAVVSNPVQQATQSLLAMAMTNPGERLMRPTYGIGLPRMTFSNGGLNELQEAAQQLQQAYTQLDGGVVNILVGISQTNDGAFVFKVQFQLMQDSTVHFAIFDFTGALVGET